MKNVRWLPELTPPKGRPLTIRGYGLEEVMPPHWCRRPRGNEDFLIMQFHSPVDLEFGQHVERHPPGSLMIWHPHQPQLYGNPETEWNHSWIHCQGRLIHRLLRKLGLSTRQCPLLVSPEYLQKFLVSLESELTDYLEPDEDILHRLVEIWLRQTARAARHTPRQRRASEKMLAIKTWLEAHYREPVQLGNLARRFGISVPHLSAEFRRCFGHSPVDYHITIRMQHAKDLLTRSELGVAEISEQLGYENPFYFSRLFKQRSGQSPRAYRTTSLAS